MTGHVTFEKDLAPGVHVRIENVPAVFRGTGSERRHYFDWKTGERLEALLQLARQRMLKGETSIAISFDDEDNAPKAGAS